MEDSAFSARDAASAICPVTRRIRASPSDLGDHPLMAAEVEFDGVERLQGVGVCGLQLCPRTLHEGRPYPRQRRAAPLLQGQPQRRGGGLAGPVAGLGGQPAEDEEVDV